MTRRNAWLFAAFAGCAAILAGLIGTTGADETFPTDEDKGGVETDKGVRMGEQITLEGEVICLQTFFLQQAEVPEASPPPVEGEEPVEPVEPVEPEEPVEPDQPKDTGEGWKPEDTGKEIESAGEAALQAQHAIDNDLPLGFYADGQVYLLLGANVDEKPYDMLADLIEKGGRITISGKQFDRGGMKAFQISAEGLEEQPVEEPTEEPMEEPVEPTEPVEPE